MSITPTSPVTGSPQTSLTSPTYTLIEDVAPNSHSEQWAVSALGGTQTGVTTHFVSDPFTLTAERPAQTRMLGVANPSTGVISNVPMNVYKFRVRKGVTIDTTQPKKICVMELKISVPAGADINDAVELRAAASLLGGFLWGDSTDVGSLPIYGLL